MRVGFIPFWETNPVQRILKDRLDDDSMEVVGIGKHPNVFDQKSVLRDSLAKGVDVVHVHWKQGLFLSTDSRTKTVIRAASVLVQLALLRLLSVRIVWTVYNRYNHQQRFLLVDRGAGILLGLLAHEVQVWDENWKEWVIDNFYVSESKLRMVPHGNYRPVYDVNPTETAETETRRRLGIPSGARVFLYFGAIRPYKQVPKLVDDFVSVNGDEDDVVLLVAGNPSSERLNEAIRERADGHDNVVTHLEFIPEEEIPRLFHASDVVVLPYDHLYHSGVLLSAMSLGKPFVAPDTGRWVNAVSPDGNVLYDDLRDGLRRATELSDEELERVGTRNLRQAETGHSWDEIVPEMLDMYSGSDAGPGGP